MGESFSRIQSSRHGSQRKISLSYPSFKLEDIYRALSVLSRESDFIQAQLYRNSSAAKPRNTRVIYYDCSNYYFEIESDEASRGL